MTCACTLSISPQVAAQVIELPHSVPLPPVRPQEFDVKRKGSPSDPNAQSKQQNEPQNTANSSCLALLKERGVEFAPLYDMGKFESCTVEEPVSFKGARLEDGRLIALDAPVTLRCGFAAELALWMRNDLAPVALRHGLKVRGLSGVGGLACRNRNRQSAGPVSEHATGNAFDVRRLVFDGAAPIDIMGDRNETTRAFRDELRVATCARFPTVLGSGADGFHEDHLHLDGRERRGGFRLCQWSVL